MDPTALLIHHIFHQAKRRARVKNIPFTISKSHISIPKFCPALGIPLFPSKSFPGPNSPTLDRINNSLGYTPNNIMVISYKANMLKGDASLSDLQQIVRYMEAFSPFDSPASLHFDPLQPLSFPLP